MNIFLQEIDEFTNLQIEEEQIIHCKSNNEKETSQLNHKITDHNIIQLPNNYIPKGLIPLEKLFDNNDVSKTSLSSSQEEDIEECNIGTHEEIINIKISTSLPKETREKYLNLLKHCKDVFSWSYEELKTYDTTLIEHKIPLKPKAKPFKHKLRK